MWKQCQSLVQLMCSPSLLSKFNSVAVHRLRNMTSAPNNINFYSLGSQFVSLSLQITVTALIFPSLCYKSQLCNAINLPVHNLQFTAAFTNSKLCKQIARRMFSGDCCRKRTQKSTRQNPVSNPKISKFKTSSNSQMLRTSPSLMHSQKQEILDSLSRSERSYCFDLSLKI
jgi:hypothetical protein